jgi:hypothetical protein
MEILLDKIYLESNKMRFGDMHNAITDYFDENEVEHAKYIAPSDPIGSETSMFILGIFALLRTFRNHPDQRNIVKQYINELCTVINATNFIQEIYGLPNMDDIVDSIKSFFGSKDDDLLDENEQIRNRFNHLVKILNKTLFNTGTNSPITIQLTISVLVFENIVNDSNIINEYIRNLKEVVLDTEEINVYETSNYRGYIKF